MIAESFDFTATAGSKNDQFFDMAGSKMPWNDLAVLLTPQAEDSLILSEKPLESAQHDFTSPLEALLTPMSSTISGDLDLSSSSDSLIFGGSPLFDDAELEDPNTWDSLFTDVAQSDDTSSGLQLPPCLPESAALEEISIKSEVITPVASDAKTNKRKREIESSEEVYKKDSLGITAYNRKPRSAPLVPIIIDEDGDTVQAKRARNTAAARRSRARKLERMSQLEEKVEELLALNKSLQGENSQLKADMADLRKVCGLE